MSYGKTVKAIRLARGINQIELAEGIMSRSNLSNFENELYTPAFDKVLSLLKKLNVGLEEFVELSSTEYVERRHYKERIVAAEAKGNLTEIKRINHELALLTKKNEFFTDLLWLTEYLLIISGQEAAYSLTSIKKSLDQQLFRHETWYSYDYKNYNNFFHLYELTENRVFYHSIKRKFLRKNAPVEAPYLANLALNYLLQLLGSNNLQEFQQELSFTQELIKQNHLITQQHVLKALMVLISAEEKTSAAMDSVTTYLASIVDFHRQQRK